MSVSRIFEYTDTDAPQLDSQAQGAIINVLRKCLVDGYGSIASLGWSVVFEDAANNKIVFRAPEGTRIFIQVDDNFTVGTYNHARVWCFESMSDVNTGVTPIPLPDSSNYNYIFKAYGSNAGNVPWRLIGDSKGFYFLTKPFLLYHGIDQYQGYGRCWFPHYLGDYIPYDMTNTYNFISALSSASEYCYWYPWTAVMSVARNARTLEIGAKVVKFAAFNVDSSGFGFTKKAPSMSPMNGRRVYEPISIWKEEGNGERGRQIYGWMPGLLSEWWSSQAYVDNGSVGAYLTEIEDVWDTSTSRRILTVPIRYSVYPLTDYINRISIVVGEGFRNAY